MTIKYIMRESKVNQDDIKFVSFSAQMHSLIAMYRRTCSLINRIAIMHFIYYCCIFCSAVICPSNIYQRTGTPIHPMSPLAKIFWMKHEWQDVFQRTAKSNVSKLNIPVAEAIE
jgi:gluconokinase